MKKRMLVAMLVCAAALFAFAQAANADCKQPTKKKLTVGMKVVAQWKSDNWWVAKITSIKKNGNIDVTFSDGEKGRDKRPYDVIPHPNELYSSDSPPCFKNGDGVVSKWSNDSWWRATIDNINGDSASITYSDKTKGTHKLKEMVPDYR
ncbi:MAG: hypothetical protein V2A66_03630 [Pseudomonadota bacterium]